MGNVVAFSDPAAIEAQAREWLIRLDSETPLTERESEALREWLGRSPAHAAELKRVSHFWNSANVLTELAVPVKRRAPVFRVARLSLAAAFAVVLVAGASWWALKSSRIASGSYGTTIGQQQLLTLNDGSSIQLNTDSQVQVSYSENLRQIRLLRGEALFTVAKDTQRPFEVHAAHGVVRAVGTAFSVHVQGNDISVAVTHGRVDIMSAETGVAPARLGSLIAGEVTTFHGSGLPSIDPADIRIQQLPAEELRRRLAWQDGYLVFAGEPLSEVVKQVNRYSATRLEVTSPEIESLAIGGRFRVGDLDGVLDVLRETFGIRATRTAGGSIRLESSASSPGGSPSQNNHILP